MHHKTSHRVEIQDMNFQKMREKRNWKIIVSIFQNRTNANEFGRNPKSKTPCFRSMIFCADGFARFFRIFQEFGQLGKIAEKERTNSGDILFFSSVSIFQTEI